MERLKNMTAPFILRRFKQDVLKDLPDKLEEALFLYGGRTEGTVSGQGTGDEE